MSIHDPAPTDVEPGTVLVGRAEERIAPSLARLLGHRRAERVLSAVGAAGVAALSAPELASTCGLPLRVAERLVAARSVADAVYGIPREPARSYSEILEHVPPWLARAEVELLLAFALTNQLHVKATLLLAKGGATGTSIAPRDAFAPLIRLGATAFVLAHNHPSGDPTPSRADVELTNALARLGRALGVHLVDHLVVATAGILSFHDVGLLPSERELDGWDALQLSRSFSTAKPKKGGPPCSARTDSSSGSR